MCIRDSYNRIQDSEGPRFSSIANRTRQSASRVRVSSQQRHETHVSKPKRENRVRSTERELLISEPCVSDLRYKDSFQKLKSPRIPEVVLFDPPPMDLRDYLTKKRSAHQIALSCCYEWLIRACFLNITAAHMQASSWYSDD